MSIEVLSPVGSSEALVAAVRSGADAVYLGSKEFSARRNAANFDDQQLMEAVKYCHLYNVKVYVTVNILIKEQEIEEAYELIKKLNDIGVDGLIVQDLGLCKIIHECFPDMELHGSTQMTVHHASALPLLKQMGFKRIVIAREMSKKEIQEFCVEAKKYEIEVEYFVHGALCMSVSGQCLLSAFIGQRSGNRGLCAQPCRLPFGAKNGTGHDLSLKDSSLYEYVAEMEALGINSLKIEGRMKRPEYVALATYYCRQAVNGQEIDTKLLKDVFSRSGFTDGYYTSKLGKQMFGTRSKEDVEAAKDTFNKIHELYRNDKPKVKIDLKVAIQENNPIEIRCGSVLVKGECPLAATSKPTINQQIEDSLAKLGNTPYILNKCEIELEEGLFVRNSSINALRRQLTEKLDDYRLKTKKRITKPLSKNTHSKQHRLTKTYVRLASLEQLPNDLDGIESVIIPIDSQIENCDLPFIVEIPRWINNEEYIVNRLNYFKEKGINKAYCNNLSAIMIAKEYGFEIIGGNYLNTFNRYSLEEYQSLDIKQVVMSCELSLKEISNVDTSLEKGIIGYGRLPLMLLRNCPLKNGRTCDKCDKKGYLTDRTGAKFPIRCKFGFSELLNSTPIYLADKFDELKDLDFMILYFTIESKDEVNEVINGYRKKEKVIKDYTRGLYYRSVY